MGDEAEGRRGRFTVKFNGDTPSRTHSVADLESCSNSIQDVSRKQENGGVDKHREDENHYTNNNSRQDDNLYLYEEDMKRMPRVATFLHSVMMSLGSTYPSEKEEKAAKQKPKKAKLGVMLGVYLPTIQHILGLLMFIRHGWITGCSGVLETCFMVFFCCLTTFVTTISLSAIATNGMVQSGGSYYMLSRNIGPECGGSIGICFYLANTLATCLYLLGAIEILLVYIAPSLAYFGDLHHDPWNNYRVYGTIFMVGLTFIVAVGVKFVALFAPISLACVIISIFSIAIGAFLASPENNDVWVCMLGERLLHTPHDWNTSSIPIEQWCNKNITGDVWHRYCTADNDTYDTYSCDSYFTGNDVKYIPAIPGMASGVIQRNAYSYYMGKGEVTPGVLGDKSRGEVVSDMTTDFIVLCAIYFPSVTGILTGANMSGDLKDPQKSLPAGTIFAQLTCSFIYMATILLYGSTVEGVVLRDKFGSSLGGQLMAALLCWPNPWVVLIGAFTSSFGAPRLLQAIARDDIIPFLGIFKATNCYGEPFRALLLSFVIAEVGVLIANIDLVAPVIDVCSYGNSSNCHGVLSVISRNQAKNIQPKLEGSKEITQFFLMCYLFVNLVCALQTLLKTPNWRPRFRYYHWTLSVLGVILNFSLCIIAGWYYALTAFIIAGFIYKYIEFKGGERAWGDGLSGLTMATAQKALLHLEDELHAKNWRPQVLVLTKLDVNQDQPVEHLRFFNIAGQLKAGRGLTVLGTVLEGEPLERVDEAHRMQALLKEMMNIHKVKGFSKVLVTPNVNEGLKILVQTVGLGGMKPNTVMMGWPTSWRNSQDSSSWRVFLDMARMVDACGMALLVPRGIDNFPDRKTRLTGTIDVWWIVHDGGMLILLAFLLKQSKVWKNCNIRIFTVAHMTDNSIQIKKDLETYLYQIRIPAEVHVEEMYEGAISAYTVEKTLDMERRARLQEEFRKSKLGRRSSDSNNHSSGYLQIPRRNSLNCRISLATSPEEVIEISRHNTPGSETTASISRHSSNSRLKRLTPCYTIGDHGRLNGNESGSEFSPNLAVPVVHEPSIDDEDEELDNDDLERNLVHFTFTASAAKLKLARSQELTTSSCDDDMTSATDSKGRLLRMHTAVQLNQTILSKSSEAQIVIVNFPAPPAKDGALENYMEYLEVLTDGLEKVIMVRGSGKEVVTMYS